MPKRSSTGKDFSQIALSIVEQATGEKLTPPLAVKPEKNPAAVALGRLGGLKGGKARLNSLTPERRKEIASQAATKRWSRRSP